MKNQWFLLSLLATFLSFISCSEDDPFPTDGEDDMSFVHSVTVGDNAYVSLFKDLNVEQTSTQNSLVFAKESFLFTYEGNIYVLESMNARLYKYRVENGLLIQEKETMILPSGSLPAFLTFDSEEKAYISCVGLGKLYIINPTTMQKTGEIDLSEYAIGKESGDKNPEPGASVIRDGILYVGLAQNKSQFNPNTGAYVLLIDTKTDKPIKMISDNRATMATAYEYSGDPFVDEKGDLYIYCVGGFGYFANCTEGFLRIKKGETEFDFGMGLREEYAQFLNVKESELVQYYPPCLCVHTCVPSRSGKYLSLESLKEGFRYLEQNGLSLAGDIVTQVACMTKPEEEYFNWHIVWFPIKEA